MRKLYSILVLQFCYLISFGQALDFKDPNVSTQDYRPKPIINFNTTHEGIHNINFSIITKEHDTIYYDYAKYKFRLGISYQVNAFVQDWKSLKEKNILAMYDGNRVFMSLPTSGSEGDFKLQEIIATNNNYILAVIPDSEGKCVMLIHDRNANTVVTKTKLQTYSFDKGKAKIDELIKPFFSDCIELLDGMFKNVTAIKKGKGLGLTNGIYNVSCK